MTLLRAICLAGGFTRIANKEKVFLRTTDDAGKPKRVVVNVGEIIKGREFDPPIKPDDIIYVPERFW